MRQQSIYDKLIEKALSLLSSRILHTLAFTNCADGGILQDGPQNEQPFSASAKIWGKQLIKIWKYLTLMDKTKQSMPKMSLTLDSLARYL
jgi:hypothetical protein